jgi:hypothetical protein
MPVDRQGQQPHRITRLNRKDSSHTTLWATSGRDIIVSIVTHLSNRKFEMYKCVAAVQWQSVECVFK